jgi:hypothetical protein
MTVLTPSTTGASCKNSTPKSTYLVSRLPCEKYVSFINPNDPDFHDYVRIRKDIPRFRWTMYQKRRVDTAIRAIAASAPGLLQRAMNGAPIPIIVMGNLDEAMVITDESGMSITLDAFTVPQDFFLRILLHECTHIVDSDYSESRQWNDLIVPRIRTYRAHFAIPLGYGDPPCHRRSLLLRKLNLPSDYVAAGSDEALAECVSFTVLGKYRAPTSIQNFIWTYFLSIPSCINVQQQLQAEAERAYNRGDYRMATETITRLLRLAPTGRAHFLQADIWSDQNELELAHFEFVQAMNCFKAGHVPEFNGIYSVLQENLSNR